MSADMPTEAARASTLMKASLASLLVSALLFTVVMLLQTSTRNMTALTGEAAVPLMERLVTQNYHVEAVGPAVNRDFTGSTLAISAGGKVHTCAELTEETLNAKKPITCKDGYVVQPKK